MQLKFVSINVDDQSKALDFYTKVLGFAKMADFTTKDIKADCGRLTKMGVKFRGEPRNNGPTTSAIFEDTCGNLIHLVQPNS